MTRILLLFTFASCIFCSCRKENEIGLNTQPQGDLISAYFQDSSTVVSYVIPDDTIQTNESSLIMIGSYVDPVFGKTSASLYTQLNLQNDAGPLDLSGGVSSSANNYDLLLDSAVLTMEYTPSTSDGRELYGNLDPQTFKVYTLKNAATVPLLTPDSPYYSNRSFPADTLIGSKTFVPSPDSNVTLGGINCPYHISYTYPYSVVYPPELRIKLNTAWVWNNIVSQNFSPNLASSSAFHNYFPGLYITSDNTRPPQANGKGAILYFNPYGGNTGLVLYYRRRVSAPQQGDTLIYTFQINTNSAFFNHYNHNNYAGTPIASRLNTNSVQSLVTHYTPHNQDFIYLQSMGGVRTLLTLPFLKNWISNGIIAVNQAQIIIPVDVSTVTTAFNAPPQLYLVAVDSTYHSYYFPVDYSDANALYGGTYSSSPGVYTFNITRQIQAILTGVKKNYGFYILTGGSTLNAQRVALYGATRTNNKLRFRLSYTKLH
jgi:hypothetical protein